MKILMALLAAGVFLSGCGAVNECVKGVSLEKQYSSANPDSKNQLSDDLRSGKLKLGDSIDDIRSIYGDADNMLVAHCSVRLIYKLSTGKNMTLWFDDGWHLSMWSD